jgi:hypothetical protein
MWHWLEKVAQASAILLHARAHAMPSQAECLAALQDAYLRIEEGLVAFRDAERELVARCRRAETECWRGMRAVRCLNP